MSAVAGQPRIVLAGATGRTGNAVAHALAARDDVELVALVAPSVGGTPTRSLPAGVPAFSGLDQALESAMPGSDQPVARPVLVDLTHADAARGNLDIALDWRVDVVLGTTGIDHDELVERGKRFAVEQLALLVVPNFSIGAVLAMRVASQLAAHFPNVEIVETHHDGKRDSPSGTAVHTAQLVAAARREAGLAVGAGSASAGVDAARGELVDGVPVHALRLPGATAHQEVVFGAPGELLTIRHDAIDRSCYAAGVVIAARRAPVERGLVVGLDALI